MNTSLEQTSVSGIKENETDQSMCETALIDGTTGDPSGESCNSGGDNMGSRSASVIVPKNPSIQDKNAVNISSAAVDNGNNQCSTTSDSVIQQVTIADCETEDSGAIMDIEVQHYRGDMTHGNIEHQSISRGKSVQTSTICDSEVQTGPGNDMAIQTYVQCHSEVQTGPSEDISVQTSTTDEHSVQTNTDKVVGVQTNTRDDSEVQTGTNIDTAVQTSTQIDRNTQSSIGNNMATQASPEEYRKTKGDSSVEVRTSGVTVVQTRDQAGLTGDTDTQTNNVDIPTSLRHDNRAQTNTTNAIGEKGTISVRQRHTGASNNQIGQTSGNMALERRTSSVTEVHTRSKGDSNLEMVTNEDIRVQPRILVDTSQGQLGPTDDFEIPHEPLRLQDDTRSKPRQSGIIVNIGENFGASRRLTPSPRGQSRSSSPFEVVRRSSGTNEDTNAGTAMDINRLRRVSQDISAETGTSGEFSSIQVGVQINRGEGSGERRECGLLTLQGTPCRRRVSSGRCYIHKK